MTDDDLFMYGVINGCKSTGRNISIVLTYHHVMESVTASRLSTNTTELQGTTGHGWCLLGQGIC